MKAALFLSILSASLLISAVPVTAQDTPLWRYTTDEDIEFYGVTPLGDLVVAMKNEITVLVPESGEPKWTRSDFEDLSAEGFSAIPFTPYGVLRTRDGITMLDLATGETMWDSTTLPIEKVRGYLTMLPHGMLLVYGETPDSKRTFAAVDIDTGEVRWRQDTLLAEDPKLERSNGIHTFVGNQPPLVDSDSTFILYVSKDGPMRIHSGTGDPLWRLDLDEDAPLLKDGFPAMLYDDGVLFVPYDKKLLALNTSDGSVIWDREEDFKCAVPRTNDPDCPLTQMVLTSRGLVVRGYGTRRDIDGNRLEFAFIDILDTRNGTSLWEAPWVLYRNVPFLARADEIYTTSDDGQLVALNALDGSPETFASIPRSPVGRAPNLEAVGGNFFLSSNSRFLSVNRAGDILYDRYYYLVAQETTGFFNRWVIPGLVGIAANAAAATASVLAQRTTYEEVHVGDLGLREWSVGVATHQANYIYVYTSQSDSVGNRVGYGLVKLDKRDGNEVELIRTDEADLVDHVMHPLGEFVFVKDGDQEIYALRLPE